MRAKRVAVLVWNVSGTKRCTNCFTPLKHEQEPPTPKVKHHMHTLTQRLFVLSDSPLTGSPPCALRPHVHTHVHTHTHEQTRHSRKLRCDHIFVRDCLLLLPKLCVQRRCGRDVRRHEDTLGTDCRRRTSSKRRKRCRSPDS